MDRPRDVYAAGVKGLDGGLANRRARQPVANGALWTDPFSDEGRPVADATFSG